MNLTQLGIATGADTKWLLNSSALLGRALRPTVPNARWWGLVRILELTFGLPLKAAGSGATRALANGNDGGELTIGEDPSSSAALTVNLLRYDSMFLANRSRALIRETPKRRGRRAVRPANAVAYALEYGLDVGLMRSALSKTPAQRLATLEANKAFVDEMRRPRGKG